MIVKDLNGKDFKWIPRSNPRNAPSTLHVSARDLIKELYPCDLIYEEVYVPKMKFYLDLYIPSCRLVLEVNGKQHYEFNNHFHNSKLDFYKKKNKDNTKKEWCELNHFRFIELPFSEKKHEWIKRING